MIGERRPARRLRRAYRLAPAVERRIALLPPPSGVAATPPPDTASERVREAGGPTDRASYACACGYVFAAAVSTTVECPHCGSDQAW